MLDHKSSVEVKLPFLKNHTILCSNSPIIHIIRHTFCRACIEFGYGGLLSFYITIYHCFEDKNMTIYVPN